MEVRTFTVCAHSHGTYDPQSKSKEAQDAEATLQANLAKKLAGRKRKAAAEDDLELLDGDKDGLTDLLKGSGSYLWCLCPPGSPVNSDRKLLDGDGDCLTDAQEGIATQRCLCTSDSAVRAMAATVESGRVSS